MRKGTSTKQAALASEPLESSEVRRHVRYGQAAHLAGVICAMAAVRANVEAAESIGATRFLAEWFAKARPDDLRLIANHVESTQGSAQDVDPVASRLIEYGLQIQVGRETVRDALARVDAQSIEAALRHRGIQADWNTVRRTLNRLGVKRAGGRPKKPRSG